jgi:hypothetical protein
VNGLLVPPGNVDALANVMRMLLADEALRRRLGEAARRRVLAEYTVERMVEQTLEVYRFAIGRSGLLQLRSAVAMLPWVSLSIARAGRRATRVSALWSSKALRYPVKPFFVPGALRKLHDGRRRVDSLSELYEFVDGTRLPRDTDWYRVSS